MSIESAKAFIERMKTDEDFPKKVLECEDSESRMAAIKCAGYDCTQEEINNVISSLSDEDLGQVCGGGIAISVSYYRDQKLL